MVDLRNQSYQERANKGKQRQTLYISKETGTGKTKITGATLDTSEGFRRKLQQAQAESEKQKFLGNPQANYQDTQGRQYSVSYKQEQTPASFEKPNVSSVQYGGSAYASPPTFTKQTKQEYIKQQTEADIRSKETSTLFGSPIPNPIGRAEAFILRDEQKYTEAGGKGLTFYGAKQKVYALEYDKAEQLRSQGIRPSQSAGFGLSSGVLRFTTDPLGIASSYAGGKLLGYGLGKGANYVGRTVQASRGAKAGLTAFNAVNTGGLVLGVGSLGAGGYVSYARNGYSGLGSFGVSAVAGFGGGYAGYRASRAGDIIDSVSDVSGSRYTFRNEKGGFLSATRNNVFEVKGTSYGVPFSKTVSSKALFAGSKVKGGYALEGSQYGVFEFPSGRSVGFADSFSGRLVGRGGTVALKSSSDKIYFSKITRQSTADVFSTDYYTSGVNPKTTMVYGTGRFSVFEKGGRLENAGLTKFRGLSEQFTARFRNRIYELPSRNTLQQEGRSVSRSGKYYTPEKDYNYALRVLNGGKTRRVSQSLASSKRGSLGQDTILEPPSPILRGGTPKSFELSGLPSGLRFRSPLFSTGFGIPSSNQRLFSGNVNKISPVNTQKSFFTPVTNLVREPAPIQQFIFIPDQKIIQEPVQRPVTSPIQKPKTTPDFQIPVITPTPPPPPFVPPFMPLVPLPLPVGFGSSERGGRGRKFQYAPSVIALLGNIRGKAPKNLGGFELRPILSKGKRRKRG